jgi:imidazolonepropionase
MTLFTNIGQLVTVDAKGAPAKPGAQMRELYCIADAAVLANETIQWIGHRADTPAGDYDVVDCGGGVVMPGFVDSHTHMVFAGSRANEFARRLAGVPYTQIAAEGGGILHTMRSVRSATAQDLESVCEGLVTSAMRHGTTTVEIKSGYGLDVESEIALLRAARAVAGRLAVSVHTTFLGAHAVPPEYKNDVEGYVNLVINEMLPRVAREGLAEFCDVFVDVGFFDAAQGERILRAAQQHGMKSKVHADEIALIGASQMAARVGAISCDHLEHTTAEGIDALRHAGTVCTLLPGTAYTLRLPYPNARAMIEAGNIVALATDCNPGSCFTENMQTVLSLACINMGMSIEEAITAGTLHGAAALGIADRCGSIEVGKRADMVLYDCAEYADVVYHFGVNHVRSVIIGGAIVA